jgi:hypothetical protein
MSDVTLVFWLALPVYLAIGVILWRRSSTIRDIFCEAGYVGGMILSAFIWPWMLFQLTVIGTIALLISLFENLFRRKQ